MFTGIIEEVGKVVRIEDQPGTPRRITISTQTLVANLRLGESVAVNGVCLTVVDRDETCFSADLTEEVWQRTSFSRAKPGTSVNIERAVRADARLGGHVVQGKIDGTGVFLESCEISGAQGRSIRVGIPSELDHLLVDRGSVAIDGISLSVSTVEDNVLTIAVVPHTFSGTSLSQLQVGDAVNIETDILARYLEKWSPGRRLRTPVATGSIEPPLHCYAIVVSKFNKLITDRMLSEAVETLISNNVSSQNIHVVSVPGAYEIPIMAKLLAKSRRFRAIICLGCIIRGQTYHFEVISNEVARGIGQSALETQVPHSLGVITCDSQEQALARVGLKSGNVGSEAALTALAMSQACSEVLRAPELASTQSDSVERYSRRRD